MNDSINGCQQTIKGKSMKIEIKNRRYGTVIYSHECENNTKAITVMKAIAKDIDLRSSDLSGIDFSGSNLIGIDLSGSDLSNSNLSNSNFCGSNLQYSNLRNSILRTSDFRESDLGGSTLRNSDLRGSDFSGSTLRGIDLRNCDLRNSDFSGSDLRNSDFSGSDLRNSILTPIRDDIWSILSSVSKEVPGLILAIKEGRIDGSTYEGTCACLVGTISNIKGVDKDSIFGLSTDALRPAERFFLGINTGDTPETNQFSALALKWCEEWLNRMQEAFGEKK